VARLIAPDANFWFTDGTHRGHDALRQAFDETWAALKDETYWLDDFNWITEGDRAAACTYRFNWTATISGEPASGSGRGTTVLERRAGRWLIVHEHLSGLPNSSAQ
jgi:ketosteroid isomerase-like protein